MKTRRRQRRASTFRIEPGDVRVTDIQPGSFEMVFEVWDGKRTKRATVKLDTWWVEYIARELWKVVAHQRLQVANNERGLRGES